MAGAVSSEDARFDAAFDAAMSGDHENATYREDGEEEETQVVVQKLSRRQADNMLVASKERASDLLTISKKYRADLAEGEAQRLRKAIDKENAKNGADIMTTVQSADAEDATRQPVLDPWLPAEISAMASHGGEAAFNVRPTIEPTQFISSPFVGSPLAYTMGRDRNGQMASTARVGAGTARNFASQNAGYGGTDACPAGLTMPVMVVNMPHRFFEPNARSWRDINVRDPRAVATFALIVFILESLRSRRSGFQIPRRSKERGATDGDGAALLTDPLGATDGDAARGDEATDHATDQRMGLFTRESLGGTSGMYKHADATTPEYTWALEYLISEDGSFMGVRLLVFLHSNSINMFEVFNRQLAANWLGKRAHDAQNARMDKRTTPWSKPGDWTAGRGITTWTELLVALKHYFYNNAIKVDKIVKSAGNAHMFDGAPGCTATDEESKPASPDKILVDSMAWEENIDAVNTIQRKRENYFLGSGRFVGMAVPELAIGFEPTDIDTMRFVRSTLPRSRLMMCYIKNQASLAGKRGMRATTKASLVASKRLSDLMRDVMGDVEITEMPDDDDENTLDVDADLYVQRLSVVHYLESINKAELRTLGLRFKEGTTAYVEAMSAFRKRAVGQIWDLVAQHERYKHLLSPAQYANCRYLASLDPRKMWIEANLVCKDIVPDGQILHMLQQRIMTHYNVRGGATVSIIMQRLISSLTAHRPHDFLKLNLISWDTHSKGKSFTMDVSEDMMPPGSFLEIMRLTGQAFNTKGSLDGTPVFFPEMKGSMVGIGKQNDADGTAEMKAMITKSRVRVVYCWINKDGDRESRTCIMTARISMQSACNFIGEVEKTGDSSNGSADLSRWATTAEEVRHIANGSTITELLLMMDDEFDLRAHEQFRDEMRTVYAVNALLMMAVAAKAIPDVNLDEYSVQMRQVEQQLRKSSLPNMGVRVVEQLREACAALTTYLRVTAYLGDENSHFRRRDYSFEEERFEQRENRPMQPGERAALLGQVRSLNAYDLEKIGENLVCSKQIVMYVVSLFSDLIVPQADIIVRKALLRLIDVDSPENLRSHRVANLNGQKVADKTRVGIRYDTSTLHDVVGRVSPLMGDVKLSVLKIVPILQSMMVNTMKVKSRFRAIENVDGTDVVRESRDEVVAKYKAQMAMIKEAQAKGGQAAVEARKIAATLIDPEDFKDPFEELHRDTEMTAKIIIMSKPYQPGGKGWLWVLRDYLEQTPSTFSTPLEDLLSWVMSTRDTVPRRLLCATPHCVKRADGKQVYTNLLETIDINRTPRVSHMRRRANQSHSSRVAVYNRVDLESDQNGAVDVSGVIAYVHEPAIIAQMKRALSMGLCTRADAVKAVPRTFQAQVLQQLLLVRASSRRFDKISHLLYDTYADMERADADSALLTERVQEYLRASAVDENIEEPLAAANALTYETDDIDMFSQYSSAVTKVARAKHAVPKADLQRRAQIERQYLSEERERQAALEAMEARNRAALDAAYSARNGGLRAPAPAPTRTRAEILAMLPTTMRRKPSEKDESYADSQRRMAELAGTRIADDVGAPEPTKKKKKAAAKGPTKKRVAKRAQSDTAKAPASKRAKKRGLNTEIKNTI